MKKVRVITAEEAALMVKDGDTVTVKIEGADEETAAPAMEKFFNEHL